MHILVEDTARNNLCSWTQRAVEGGTAKGAILSPFASPRLNNGYKQSAQETAERIRDCGGEFWFDPSTHALQMPNVGDYRYYVDWDLWGQGAQNVLTSKGDQRDHVSRVFAIQDELGAPHLAPTVLLHSPQSTTSQRALEMAEIAAELDPQCFITVAGDAGFWGAGNVLDAHVGGLAQIAPAGWFLVVARSLSVLPVPVDKEDVHGLCRTARSLSEDGPVHVSHGDLAALPAFTAGATTIGTGWDPRQRVYAYSNYAQREAGGEGGQWFAQTTLEGLLSLLPRAEVELLNSGDASLAVRLLPGNVPPGAPERWDHHAQVLHNLGVALASGGKASYETLQAAYETALSDWGSAAAVIGTSSKASAWLQEVSAGLRLFAASEGW